jgi:hypothetical protein
MNRTLDILRSPVAMMVALMLALTAQGKHTADVFTFFSHPGTPQWLSYAFAAAVEVAVLLFVLNRHKHISYAFAVATFATNVVYYAIGGIALQSIALVPVVLLSALLPGVIVGYSHTIAEHTDTAPAQPQAEQARYRWQFWRKPLETPAELPTLNDTTPAPIVAPVPAQSHSEAAGKTRKPRKVAKTGKLTQEQRRAQILSAGLQTSADVQRIFTVSKRTADGDLAEVRKALLQTNGNGAH